MKSDRRLPVAIIGGGFSGTIVGAQLARRGIDAVMIEPEVPGLGAAYSTIEPAHLLNVRAASMSAWPDDAAHFASYAAQEGVPPDGFAQRRLFGRYVREILESAVGAGRLAIRQDRAVAARHDGDVWMVRLSSGDDLPASILVLAIGNQAPEPLPAFASAGERFATNPWAAGARGAIAQVAAEDLPVILVGTGLTMVDLVLSLDAAGHQGMITAVSRRGLLPRAHADAGGTVDPAGAPAGELVALMQWLRRRGGEAGWRAAIDSMRPISQQLWQRLGVEQQRRFLRHARPWWDVHRHRIAPQVAGQIRGLVEQGRLEVLAGRITTVEPRGGHLNVAIGRRGGELVQREAAFAFNCTGPLGSIQRTRDPLLRQMLDEGLIASDELGIGLDVDERSRAGPRLWAVGPPTKGRFWEIVAVPDIRIQAEAVATDIAEELGR